MARRRRRYNSDTPRSSNESATDLLGVGARAEPSPEESASGDALEGASAEVGGEDEGWYDDEPPPRRRGYTGVMMRHPLLLLLVLGLGIFTIVRYLHLAELYFADPAANDYGDVIDRPQLRSEGKTPVAFQHGVFAKLAGTVGSPVMLYQAPSGGSDSPDAPGARYFVKVAGDNVFLVVDASRPDVIEHRNQLNSLLGFGFEGVGRMISSNSDPLYASVVRTLRLKFSLKDDEPVWLFDTTDRPEEYQSYLIILCFSGLVILLALFGLYRYWRRRGET